MAVGIQIFDGAGNLIVDTTKYFYKTASLDIGEVTQPGSVNLSAITNAGAVLVPAVQNLIGAPAPEVAVNNGVISWAKQSANAPAFRANIRVAIV